MRSTSEWPPHSLSVAVSREFGKGSVIVTPGLLWTVFSSQSKNSVLDKFYALFKSCFMSALMNYILNRYLYLKFKKKELSQSVI
jgi:hypothetical protein